MAWKSEKLVAKPTNPWITPTENLALKQHLTMKKQLTGLKLTAASPLLTMVAIGTSIEGEQFI
jgi:hypothetical protein